MFKFNNTHIFTGYLKQLLSSVNIPTCKIYTKDFAEYKAQTGKEDPRVIESIDTLNSNRLATRINYLKNNELYNFFWDYSEDKLDLNRNKANWNKTLPLFYSSDTAIAGLTKTLYSPGNSYDTTTHEHLGEYLRFLRDYHEVDLMSLYNCFNNKIYSNIYFNFEASQETTANKTNRVVFDSRDSSYHIYAFPVKLFSDYTIAINCNHPIEMFCGFYKTVLDTSQKSTDLARRTYKKINRTFYNQTILYDKLNVKYWNFDIDVPKDANGQRHLVDSNEFITRWDIANREQDLKLFLKIPTSCKSSITVLEGNFKNFNDALYVPSSKKSLTMDSCFVGENVTLKGITAAGLRGFIAEKQDKNLETFTNCYSRANVLGEQYYGLVGPTDTTNNVIACCYNSTTPIAGSSHIYNDLVGSKVGMAYKVINSYESFVHDDTVNTINAQYTKASQVTYIAPENLPGKDKAKTTSELMPHLNSDNKYIITDNDYPKLRIFTRPGISAKMADATENCVNTELAPLCLNGPIWRQGDISEPKYSEADGCYEITNGAELAYIIEKGGENKYYKLTHDIFLNDPSMIDWLTGELTQEGKDANYSIRRWYYYLNNNLKAFKGTIDGDGHVVYGLYCSRSYTRETLNNTCAGLLPLIASKSNVTIKNLGIDYAYIHAEYATGFIGALSASESSVSNKLNTWEYHRNHVIINFGTKTDKIDTNTSPFTPISKLQLLAFNTGESYPFADRLVEYLSKSAITPIDEITDNIKRAQKVMKQNEHYFKIEGFWEEKMQKIIYDYLMSAGPFEYREDKSDTNNKLKKSKNKIIDKRLGRHPRLGYVSKSTLYDVLGYIDKNAEKWYAHWEVENGVARPKESILTADIYDGLFDI